MTMENTDTMTPPLIATCWTSAGDAAPLREDESSPFPLADAHHRDRSNRLERNRFGPCRSHQRPRHHRLRKAVEDDP